MRESLLMPQSPSVYNVAKQALAANGQFSPWFDRDSLAPVITVNGQRGRPEVEPGLNPAPPTNAPVKAPRTTVIRSRAMSG
jgi:hypothetical protein